MRVGRQIRAPKVRVIDNEGKQVGILALNDALVMADAAGLELVEIAPTAKPPVCKIVDYGKYRYQVTKKEKESKKAQVQVKVKEIKVKPNTDDHDLETKIKHGREFILKGNKVRVTCMFRGREMQHPEIGKRVVQKICDALADVGIIESPPKQMGKNLSVVIMPGAKKKTKEQQHDKNENSQSSEKTL